MVGEHKVPPLREIIRFADDLASVGMTGLESGWRLKIRIHAIRKTNDMTARYNRRNFGETGSIDVWSYCQQPLAWA